MIARVEPKVRIRFSISGLLAALKECSVIGDLDRGRKLHADAIASGLSSSIFVGSCLISMYSKCGSLGDAQRVFDFMPDRNVVSWTALMLGFLENSKDLGEARQVFDRIPHYDAVTWNALLLGYAENGEARKALDLFQSMLDQGCRPNARTFVGALKACSFLAAEEQGAEIEGRLARISALDKGMFVHSRAADLRCDSEDIFVGNTLVDMYSKCGSLVDARWVFDRMLRHTVVSWNALLLGCAENGEGALALELFGSLEIKDAANSLTFVAALKACSSLAIREAEKQVDGRFVKVVSLEICRDIHAQAASSDCALDILFANTLVDAYAKCGSMVDARRVFDDTALDHTVVSWNSLLLGYVENGEEETALALFGSMNLQGQVLPNARTFVAALKACACLAAKEAAREVDGKLVKVEALKKGLAIHSEAASSSCESDIFVASTLLDMHAKCGNLAEARKIFDRMPFHSVVSWTALMMGFADNGEEEAALELFVRMTSRGSAPDTLTIVAAMKACIGLAVKEQGKLVDGKLVKALALRKGMEIYKQAVRWGCDSEIFLANTFLELFTRCGSLENARQVFEKMAVRSIASWNALIVGCVENGEDEMALEAFARMRLEDDTSSLQSFLAAVKACGSSADVRLGKAVHRDACRLGMETDSVLATSLVDLYGKCGSMAEAHQIFDSLGRTSVDTVTWTALLAGFSRQGDCRSCFRVFNRMIDEGVEANGVTFLCVLIACSHAGRVEEGKKYFEAMRAGIDRIRPGVEHYHCMVDLLGRSNQLEAALEFISTMPYEANAVTWKTLLGACQKWKNAVIGKVAFDKLLLLNGKDGGAAFSLMANIYGSGLEP